MLRPEDVEVTDVTESRLARGANFILLAGQSAPPVAKYSPDQERDEQGRFAGGGDARPTMDQMYEKAALAKPVIDKLAMDVAIKLGGTVEAAPLKSRARAEEKAARDYGGDASRLKDIARNTILVPQGREQDALKALLAARPDIDPATMVKVTDPARDPLGYQGILVTVPAAGIRAEVQISSPAMVVAKEPIEFSLKALGPEKVREVLDIPGNPGCCRGHSLYERWRVMRPGSAEADLVARESREYYASWRKAAAHQVI